MSFIPVVSELAKTEHPLAATQEEVDEALLSFGGKAVIDESGVFLVPGQVYAALLDLPGVHERFIEDPREEKS